jgi:hypothetical protein
MAQRYTVKSVRGMFGRMIAAAELLGIDTSSWVLQEGSGNGYRLFRKRTGGGLFDIGGLSGGMLGDGAREATRSLELLAVAWEYAAYNRDTKR